MHIQAINNKANLVTIFPPLFVLGMIACFQTGVLFMTLLTEQWGALTIKTGARW